MKDITNWNEGDWIAAIAALALFATLAIGGLIATRKSEEFVGHPRGLFVLFYAEMWERFSYYGMRALLILYLTKFWLFNDGDASLIYGGYTSLVYITPVLGGYLADRWLGQRKAVLFGGVVLALGHLFMAWEGMQGVADPAVKQADPAINVFWLALSLIIVGSGFLKANISVIVGQLYKMTDARRDSAYTIFYMGVNVGAALGTILVGYLGETIGWSWGFGLAGIGMVLGLIIFVVGKPALLGQGEPPRPLQKNNEFKLYGTGIAAVAVIWFLIQYVDVIQNLLIITGVAMLAYTLYEAFKLPKEPRERIFAILFLIALNPVFWGLFEQAGGSLSLYTDKYVDRGGVPTSLFQSINPIYIVLFAPLFAGLWQILAKRGLEPSAPAKFGLALVQVGLGFLVFVWGAGTGDPAVMTSVVFVFLIYLLHTTGELCLSPVGLSAMTRLAPAHLGSFIMGAWFYMTAVGNFVAGKIGEATGGESGEMSKDLTLAIYSKIGWVTIGIAVVVLLLSPIVKRWMHLDSLEDRDHDDGLMGQGEVGLEAQEAGMHPENRPT
ncbi:MULTISPECIES: peptide MFS transporter [Novosphingobium]|uniref:Proton-dependent oligopeptide transporter, POT family n=1 Tax=Novosphingobium mathurense TaxID=428990 RepID=A0A1U6IP35_9SPHN|nr:MULTISPECIES: peptide MFS transporter [Novosphingobium]CDO37193.1 Di-tripeptide ABC transporter-like protein [Novosphingobium sp. KN65.2]SLK09778.1 proton-dependent oligopeptide transporter, POT family [Novosphingobium mathurense]